jgi:hypothetical protein
MFRRKLLAALAVVMTALAVALPVSANAATSPPVVPPIPSVETGVVNQFLCPLLVTQLRFAMDSGNVLLANLVNNVFMGFGCGGAAT